MLPLISQIYDTSQSIFTTKDLALLWVKNNPTQIKDILAYHTKQKHLVRLTRGVYAKNLNFDPLELGSSLYAPSYISFQIVLQMAGIIFQHQNTVTVAAIVSKTKTVAGRMFTFHKLKENILFNHSGVEYKNHYSIATAERAFLDTIYLYPNFYCDNLRPLNWEKCWELVPLYNNKKLITRLRSYQKDYAESK